MNDSWYTAMCTVCRGGDVNVHLFKTVMERRAGLDPGMSAVLVLADWEFKIGQKVPLIN